MKFNLNSFPVLVLFSLIFFFLNSGCGIKQPQVIAKKQFIEIYARLLIIDEMELSPEYKQLLRNEVLQQYKTTRADLYRTIEFYNSQPEKWVDILGKTRDRIDQLRTAKLKQTVR